ncbi:Hypothetical_protein [Hexamita inflata]|uniref:Hypothetical_protein n=1 Tax=Hexamita inflata TaxID=28002 RepID=A0AA86UQI0_9EUKA|nr:Hypothetical protein HINF_LOCUS55365 [Hexamita inflata]
MENQALGIVYLIFYKNQSVSEAVLLFLNASSSGLQQQMEQTFRKYMEQPTPIRADPVVEPVKTIPIDTKTVIIMWNTIEATGNSPNKLLSTYFAKCCLTVPTSKTTVKTEPRTDPPIIPPREILKLGIIGFEVKKQYR